MTKLKANVHERKSEPTVRRRRAVAMLRKGRPLPLSLLEERRAMEREGLVRWDHEAERWVLETA